MSSEEINNFFILRDWEKNLRIPVGLRSFIFKKNEEFRLVTDEMITEVWVYITDTYFEINERITRIIVDQVLDDDPQNNDIIEQKRTF